MLAVGFGPQIHIIRLLIGDNVGEGLADKLRQALQSALLERFCHHGPYVAQLDYIGADGKRVQKEERCKEPDIDP